MIPKSTNTWWITLHEPATTRSGTRARTSARARAISPIVAATAEVAEAAIHS